MQAGTSAADVTNSFGIIRAPWNNARVFVPLFL
jgi:hypothetical protein